MLGCCKPDATVVVNWLWAFLKPESVYILVNMRHEKSGLDINRTVFLKVQTTISWITFDTVEKLFRSRFIDVSLHQTFIYDMKGLELFLHQMHRSKTKDKKSGEPNNVPLCIHQRTDMNSAPHRIVVLETIFEVNTFQVQQWKQVLMMQLRTPALWSCGAARCGIKSGRLSPPSEARQAQLNPPNLEETTDTVSSSMEAARGVKRVRQMKVEGWQREEE